MSHRFVIRQIPGTVAVVRMDSGCAIPPWAWSGPLSGVIRTTEELSIVCDQAAVPGDCVCERDWVALKIEGPLGFSLTGVLASLLAPLASRGIVVFVLSTFDTDYILVKQDRVIPTRDLLRAEGHDVA
jgi:uncharacterized protein